PTFHCEAQMSCHFRRPETLLENRGADTSVCRLDTHVEAFRERSGSAIQNDFHPLLCAGQTHAYSSRPTRFGIPAKPQFGFTSPPGGIDGMMTCPVARRCFLNRRAADESAG